MSLRFKTGAYAAGSSSSSKWITERGGGWGPLGRTEHRNFLATPAEGGYQTSTNVSRSSKVVRRRGGQSLSRDLIYVMMK